jgi:hypothetical protein
VDKSLLFKPRLPEGTVLIPGVGEVRVRGLTREEVLTFRDLPTAEHERKVLAAACLDPELSAAEVHQWQRACPAGEIRPVVRAVLDLSGLGEESARDAYRTFRDGPGDGLGSLPGGEAGDDGGAAAGGDAGG